MTWKPVVAGIINIAIGVMNLFGMFLVIVVLVAVGGGALAVSRVTEALPLWLSGTIEGVMVVFALVLAVFSALPLIGGVNALQRKNWRLALAGAIVATLSTTLPGIAATVLVALSREEFE